MKSCELIFIFFVCFFFGRGGDPPIEGYAGIHKIERDVVYLCTCVPVYCVMCGNDENLSISAN